jgi:DNA repair protein RecO (recombination protein O)
MEWRDSGIVLAARRHGETSAVVSLLTERHGRHAGLVRGGMGRRARGVYQPGNEVAAHWRARLADHLGHFTCELVRARAGPLLDQPLPLAALAAACAVVEAALPERHPYPALHAGLLSLLDALADDERWPEAYARWELALLGELGFGLDLTACAASGVTENLIYVSPRSGRAVSGEAGARYRDRLLPLPPFVRDGGTAAAGSEEVAAGLKLTGWFLSRHVFADHGGRTPAARDRFVERLGRASGR